jgi:hypothetical protein
MTFDSGKQVVNPGGFPFQAGIAVAGVAQLVEHNVANVVVVGSNPIARFSSACCFPLRFP